MLQVLGYDLEETRSLTPCPYFVFQEKKLQPVTRDESEEVLGCAVGDCRD